ncbi:hypothetical protein [Winogradskyella sp. 3972H.M.0a.05]|uniref:toxin-antitoxin system YwqK family antitoxin n=1 Tax=Winogradskyella sp. 3972H.M.0a.05 TaxID=2950277 RepID=UPI0033967DA6
MKQLTLLLFAFLLSISANAEKMYQKVYYDNGTIKAEGWTNNNTKHGYWKFYHENGVLKEEGHFRNGKKIKYWYFYTENGKKKSEGHYVDGIKSKWWLFYDDMEQVNHKCQLKNNQKNGYCLRYKNKKIVKAEKYEAGKKVNEWTDFRSFKRDNKLSDLR